MDEAPVEVKILELAQEPLPPERVPAPPSSAAPAEVSGAAAGPTPAVPSAAPAPAALLASLHPEIAAQAKALEEQIAARPEARGLYVKLADLLQNAGQKDAAIGVLERLLGVDPANALAKHRIDVLRGTVRHAPPAVIGMRPAMPPRPAARPAARRSSRPLWAGLGTLAVVLVAAGFWLLSGPTRLVAGRGPVFSPQGDRIAYFTDAAGGGATLNVLDLKSGRSRSLGKATGFGLGGDAVAWSPDGTQVAFGAAGETGEETVFVANAESGVRRALTVGSSPTFSPDGLSVGMFCHEPPKVLATDVTEEGEVVPTAFTDGWDGVCLVDVADARVRRLHQGPGSRLAFSPRSPMLVLERFPEDLGEGADGVGSGGDDEIQALADEATRGGATNVYEGSRDLGRAVEARGLNRRGAGSVGSVFGDLFAIDAWSGAVTALTSDGRSSSPRWAADGRIVYVHQPAGASQAGLWVMGADGSGQQAFVQATVELFDPTAVAVGGDRVVYAAPIKDVDTGLAKIMTGEEAADLHVVRPGDRAPRRLKNRHTFKQRFSLSADGRRIAYEARDRETGQSEIWLMKP
jgi:hypothetical protein